METMRNWFWLLISVAGLAAAEPPPRLEVTYQIARNGSAMAEVTEQLEYSGGNYKLTETWKGRGIYALLGSARRVSQGTIDKSVLRPREFFDERSGRDTARAWFDWKAGTLTMQYQGQKKSEPLPPNAQDRLSFLFALSLLPGSGSDAVSYSIFDGKGQSRHSYKVTGRERVSLPIGELDAIKVQRVGDEDNASVWLAVAHGNVPVRLLVIEKDGARYDQQAIRISK
jgi:hypothetical protein